MLYWKPLFSLTLVTERVDWKHNAADNLSVLSVSFLYSNIQKETTSRKRRGKRRGKREMKEAGERRSLILFVVDDGEDYFADRGI